eukprot:COSAG06_NODE_1906_length_8092_cov_8.987864_2_plen_49_part_00
MRAKIDRRRQQLLSLAHTAGQGQVDSSSVFCNTISTFHLGGGRFGLGL